MGVAKYLNVQEMPSVKLRVGLAHCMLTMECSGSSLHVQLSLVEQALSCRLCNIWGAPNTKLRKVQEARIACCIQATHGQSYKNQQVHLCFQLTQTFPRCISFHVCMQLWPEIHCSEFYISSQSLAWQRKPNCQGKHWIHLLLPLLV